MTLPDLASLRQLVRAAAREHLLPRFSAVQRHVVKDDGSLVTDADHAVQAHLQAELTRRWPHYAVLGEEMPREEQVQLTAAADGGLWCLDPLDGTSNYAAGVPFFSVSLALVVGTRVVLGLVYDPVRDECFVARRGDGAWLNERPLTLADRSDHPLKRAIAVVDFKRLDPALAARLAAYPPYGSQRNFGASSLEWCWLADGRFHVYLHGGQKLWDYAAGNLIAMESGALSCTLEADPVFLLALETRSVVAAVRPNLFDAWRQNLGVRAV
ncbi:MAG: inositol monophosphatase family protein [Pseudomonadota bacterium]|nr:MAG: inositol monophosphatase family protein [Pseudomonadota bacterium]